MSRALATPAPVLTPAFAVLVGAHFLQGLGYASMILLPVYLAWLDASRATIGGIMALGAVGGLLTRPVVGWALDSWGRRSTLALGTAVLVFGVAALSRVEAVGLLLVAARLAIGVGTGVLFTGYFTFAADIVPEQRRTEGLALFGISGLLPLLVNPVSAWVGVEGAGLPAFYGVVAALIAVSFLGLWWLREPERRGASGPIPPSAAIAALRARPLWPVWWATLVFGGLVYVFMSFATVAAESRGVADPTLLWLSYAGASVGVRAIGPGLPDRLGPSRVLVPAMLSYVAAFALAAAADSLPAFLVAGFLGGLAHGYCFPILAGQTFTRSPPHLRGSAMAAFTALWDAASLLFVPLAGLLADLAGDRWMFGTVVICTLLALVGWARLERRHAPALTPRGPDVG